VIAPVFSDGDSSMMHWRNIAMIEFLGSTPQPESIVTDHASERIVSDKMEQEIFPAMAADPLGIA
jgi:hypothetical protein